MLRRRKVLSILAAALVLARPDIASAMLSIDITDPSSGTTYVAGSTITCSGTLGWNGDQSEDPDTPPAEVEVDLCWHSASDDLDLDQLTIVDSTMTDVDNYNYAAASGTFRTDDTDFKAAQYVDPQGTARIRYYSLVAIPSAAGMLYEDGSGNTIHAERLLEKISASP